MNKLMKVFVCIISLIVGVAGGAGFMWYASLPETEELVLGEEVFYSYNSTNEVSNVQLTGEEGELSVHFLELGNKYTGDCTYIKYGDVDILIDCGSKSSSISYVSDYLKSYMSEGDTTIDYCIVTHAHTDHFAGFATSGKVKSLFELFNYGTIIDFGSATNKSSTSGALKNYITKRNLAVTTEGEQAEYFDVSTGVSEGNNKVYEIGANGEVKLEILYNYYYDHSISGTENNYSVCVLLTYDNKEFLFTGDLEEHGSEGETKLLQYNKSLQAIQESGDGVELYKAGHHGSKTSSSEGFIDAIQPKVVCVCCCAGSEEYTTNIDNQFPTQTFINIIAKYTKYIYVTTLCVDWENDEFTSMNGNIVVIAKLGQDLGVDCSNNETILKETEWFNRTITVDGVERPMRTWPPEGKQ
ncbi:MAG: MBL fold metallo-hydrolase [Clostridia bacterium]|nr:MBL fold metallo-hydrolase [Clostridia bacterium]